MTVSPNVTPLPALVATAFWDAAREGVFTLPRCDDCQSYFWYPRAHCPYCLGHRVDWVSSPGRGHVYASTVMRKAEAPYCIAYIELDEGPRLLSGIVNGDPELVRIGQRVEVVFIQASEPPHQNVPFFRRADGHEE